MKDKTVNILLVEDDEVDALEADVTEWGKQEAAARALKTLTPKQRAKKY